MTKTIQEMAQELGVKKENLESGLKKDVKGVTEAITKAYDFKFKKKVK
jgi:hypothetical protein